MPLDLTGENQFAFSTNSASPMVVAWGSSETFGQHAGSDRVRNLSVPPLQPKADNGDSVPGVGDTVCVEGFVMVSFLFLHLHVVVSALVDALIIN